MAWPASFVRALANACSDTWRTIAPAVAGGRKLVQFGLDAFAHATEHNGDQGRHW